MHLIRLVVLASTFSAAAVAAPVAEPFVQRELVLPAESLRIDAGHRFPRYDTQFKYVFVRDASDEQYLNPGVSYGLGSDVEIGLVWPFQIAPGSELRDPRAHVLFQFEDGVVDLGVLGVLDVGIWGDTTLTAGVPLLWHASSEVRLDSGAFLELRFADTSQVGLIVPFFLPFQVSTDFYVGPELVFEVGDLFSASGVGLDLGGGLGYTVLASGSSLLDLTARLRARGVTDPLARTELMVGVEWFLGL